MTTEYKYSLIIPHHNIPDLLDRCLKSIPRRDDIQIIIVDDNSSNVDFNQFPGLGEPNVEIIYSKSGKGAGAARNEGMRLATGKWLIFIDADDFLTPEALDIWDNETDDDSDIIYFSAKSVDESTFLPNAHLDGRHKSVKRLQSKTVQLHRYLRFCYTEPWGKLFRRDFIALNNIKFQESQVANDYLFSILTGLNAQKIRYCDKQFYNYIIRSSSLSNNQLDSHYKIISRIKVYETVQQIFIEHRIGLRPLFQFLNWIIFRSSIPKSEINAILEDTQLDYNSVKYELLKSWIIPIRIKLYQKLNIPYCGF